MLKKQRKILAVLLAATLSIGSITTSGLTVRADSNDDVPAVMTEEGLEMYFDMDEMTEDGMITDKVTNQTFKVEGDSPSLTDGCLDFNNALKLGGTNYVDLGTNFQPTHDYTIMAWVKPAAVANRYNQYYLLGRGKSGDKTDQLSVLSYYGRFYHYVSSANDGDENNTYQDQAYTNAFNNDTWMHLTFIRSGDKIISYINGEQNYSRNGYYGSQDILPSESGLFHEASQTASFIMSPLSVHLKSDLMFAFTVYLPLPASYIR